MPARTPPRPNRPRRLTLAGATALLAPVALFAQDLDVSQLHELDDDQTDIRHEGFTIDDIEDMDVMRDGEEIGEVEAVLADASGEIVALAIDFDDRVRENDDAVVPIDAVEFAADRREVHITLTNAELAALPDWDD